MAPNGEEAYEVNLGNKQLLALFFIVTGFFALFFCAGYMIGFGHGEKTPGLAQAEEPAPEPAPPALPATLRQDPPAPPPVAKASPKPTPASAPPKQPEPMQQAPAPKRTAPEKPAAAAASPEPKPTPPPAKPEPPKTAPAAANQGGYYLQVAAVRVEADATQLAGQLKSKGYPAVVNAGKGDGWQRVVVGPFSSPEAAKSFKAKLTKDGFDTMLRKL